MVTLGMVTLGIYMENTMNMQRIPVCFLFVVVLTLTACSQATPTPLPTQTAIPRSAEEIEAASNLLLEATKSGDLAGVVTALEQGADIDTREAFQDMTPLIIASTRGFTEIATHLIEAGADVNAMSKQGITPLIGAALDGHTDLVTLLATKNTNLDQLSNMRYKENALHLAARNGHTAVIEALLKAGADINALEGTHSTALMYAAYNGRLEASELLIKQGTDLNKIGRASCR